MRAALDTNILAYAEGVGNLELRDASIGLIERIPPESILLPAQTLAELYRVLAFKAKRRPDEARTSILLWADSFEVADSTWTAVQAAFDLAVDHTLGIWDAVILSVAAEHRCRLLLTEDLQHGFTWRGVTVVDPFKTPAHPLLSSLI